MVEQILLIKKPAYYWGDCFSADIYCIKTIVLGRFLPVANIKAVFITDHSFL